jgi:hypothetical protein
MIWEIPKKRRTSFSRTQDPRPKTQDPRPKTQDPRPKTQDPRPKTQDPRPRPQLACALHSSSPPPDLLLHLSDSDCGFPPPLPAAVFQLEKLTASGASHGASFNSQKLAVSCGICSVLGQKRVQYYSSARLVEAQSVRDIVYI